MRTKRFALAVALLVNVVTVGLVSPFAGFAGAAGPAVFVTPSNTQGWSSTAPLADTRPGGAVTFVADPAAPGGGSGALRLTADSSSAKAQYFRDAAQTPLSTVTELSFWTKQLNPLNNTATPSYATTATPSYQMAMCLNGVTQTGCAPNMTTAPNPPFGPTSFATLVYEPYQGTPGTPVQSNVWQSWDVDQGLFFSTRTVQCSGGTIPGGSGGPANLRLADVKAACPDAVVLSYGVNVGTGNSAYNVLADLFNFNGTVFDFELGTDLAISKTAQPDPVNAGSNVTYTITVINSGPGDAPATVVTDNLPAGTTFVSCNASAGGVCGGSGNNRTVTFTSLTAGSSAIIQIVASVATTVADGTALTNTASVTSFEPETNLANNSSAASVSVRNPAVPGAAPVASVAPTSLTFGSQTVGTTSAAQTVTLSNTGNAPLAINVITISGDFAQTNNCPASLAANASCTINVTFTALAAGSRTGVLTIFDDAAGSPQNVALSGTGVAAPAPSPAPVIYTVNVSQVGAGSVDPGSSTYASGSQATYRATAGAGQIFIGWTLDGQYVGYASPLTFTVNGNRSLVATFAARPTFSDVPATDPDYEAITRLAALGIINPRGVNNSGNFEPGRSVARAETAAFIARVFGWNREFHANPFPDKCDNAGSCVDDELWNNVAALADYGVVGGYTDNATCQSAGTTAPCYLPRDQVVRVQVVSIVARSFIKQPDLRPTGFWDRQDANGAQYTNVPNTGTQRSDLTTYRSNAGPIPGQADDGTFPDPGSSASRRFIIEVLFQAYYSVYSVDNVP